MKMSEYTIEDVISRLAGIDKKLDKLLGTPINEVIKDYLLELPDHLRDTMKVLITRGASTADMVSEVTGKARAVESGYLNQLLRDPRAKVVSFRNGRLKYFKVKGDFRRET
jgi:hypothetical protein